MNRSPPRAVRSLRREVRQTRRGITHRSRRARRSRPDERTPAGRPSRALRVRHTFRMDIGSVRVEGHYEVLALHRYLFDAKGEDISSEYAGSPFIAAIQNRLADALEAADPGSGWTKWRAAGGHQRRVDTVRHHLMSSVSHWNDMGREQRRAYVKDLLAPLRIPEDLLAELVEVQAVSAPARSTDDHADGN
jgi:hypothetical protein